MYRATISSLEALPVHIPNQILWFVQLSFTINLTGPSEGLVVMGWLYKGSIITQEKIIQKRFLNDYDFNFLISCSPKKNPIPNNNVINAAKYGISSVIFFIG